MEMNGIAGASPAACPIALISLEGRVFGGMLAPQAYLAMLIASGLCWSAAFALYAVRYWPVLTRPRLDGKPG